MWPVQLPDGRWLPAHTRFETTLHAGEMLVWPPAYFHATHILAHSEYSHAVVQYVLAPVWGQQDLELARAHPFGYEACMRVADPQEGLLSWRQVAAACERNSSISISREPSAVLTVVESPADSPGPADRLEL